MTLHQEYTMWVSHAYYAWITYILLQMHCHKEPFSRCLRTKYHWKWTKITLLAYHMFTGMITCSQLGTIHSSCSITHVHHVGIKSISCMYYMLRWTVNLNYSRCSLYKVLLKLDQNNITFHVHQVDFTCTLCISHMHTMCVLHVHHVFITCTSCTYGMYSNAVKQNHSKCSLYKVSLKLDQNNITFHVHYVGITCTSCGYHTCTPCVITCISCMYCM